MSRLKVKKLYKASRCIRHTPTTVWLSLRPLIVTRGGRTGTGFVQPVGIPGTLALRVLRNYTFSINTAFYFVRLTRGHCYVWHMRGRKNTTALKRVIVKLTRNCLRPTKRLRFKSWTGSDGLLGASLLFCRRHHRCMKRLDCWTLFSARQ